MNREKKAKNENLILMFIEEYEGNSKSRKENVYSSLYHRQGPRV